MTLQIGDDPAGAEYERAVDRWIVAASLAGAEDFWRLVSLLPGVYPTDVRRAVNRLAMKSMVPPNLAFEVSTHGREGGTTPEVPDLPSANPLSADWRFTRDTAEQLLERLTGLAGPAQTVALLGVPSVFRMAVLQQKPRRFILVDQNESFVPSSLFGEHSVQCLDLRKEAPEVSEAGVILADPPWYEDETRAFLFAAARICAQHGFVLLGVPAEGARPGVSGERERMVAWAEELGLQLLDTEPLALSYVTPFFEYNALHAAGFKHISRNWRRGDLMIFKMTNPTDAYPRRRIFSGPEWVQVDIHDTAFWVRRRKPAGFVDPRLRSLVAGDILPTVSRRDRRREFADVWTAGNRMYGCRGGHIFLTILRAIKRRQEPVAAVEKSLRRPLQDTESAGWKQRWDRLNGSCKLRCRRSTGITQGTFDMTLSDELVAMLKRSTYGHGFWEEYLEPLAAADATPSPFTLPSCWNLISATYLTGPKRSNPGFPRTASLPTIW